MMLMLNKRTIFIYTVICFSLFGVLTIANAQPYKCVPKTCGPNMDVVQDVTGGGYVPGSRLISTGTGLSGGGDLTADRTLSIANTAVTPGSYTNTELTVNAQGRITAASDGVSVELSTVAGQLLFGDGSGWTNTETSEMFWDDTGKTFAIGTDTPGATLDVRRSGETSAADFHADDNTGWGMRFFNDLYGTTDDFAFKYWLTTAGSMRFVAPKEIRFYTDNDAGNSVMTLTPEERVYYGNVPIANAKLTSQSFTDAQLELRYNQTSKAGMSVSDSGNLTVIPTGGNVTLDSNVSITGNLDVNGTITGDRTGTRISGTLTTQDSISTLKEMPDNILGFYNFQESTTKDVSGWSLDGTEAGAPTISGGWLQLDGVDDAVDLSSNVYAYANSKSFSVSAKMRTSTATATQAILSLSDRNVATTFWLIFINSSGYGVFQCVELGAIDYRYVYEVDLRDGLEHHFAATSGPDGNAFWIDNVSVTNIVTGTPSNTKSIRDIQVTDVNIGRSRDSSGYEFPWKGDITDVVLMNRQLTATDVSRIYNDGLYGFEVLPLMGQSNMIGADDIRVGIDDVYTSVSGIVYQYAYSTSTVIAATNPLDFVDESPGKMGLWLEFCNNWVDDLPYGRGILLVPIAEGGTGFLNNNWNPGDVAYERAITNTQAALAVSELNTLAGILWHQGEKDALDESTTYFDDILAMHTGLKTDLGISDHTPFIIGELRRTVYPGTGDKVNADLKRFAEYVPGVRLYTGSELAGIDYLHYSAASLVTMGQGYYDLFRDSIPNNVIETNYVKQNGVYASIHVHDASTAQSIPVGVTYTKVTAYEDNTYESNALADVANDQLIITVPGVYNVNGFIAFESGTDKINWWGAPFLDDVEQNQIHFYTASLKDTPVDASFSGFIRVSDVPAILDFRVRHSDALLAADMTVVYANLQVSYVGRTE